MSKKKQPGLQPTFTFGKGYWQVAGIYEVLLICPGCDSKMPFRIGSNIPTINERCVNCLRKEITTLQLKVQMFGMLDPILDNMMEEVLTPNEDQHFTAKF